MPAYRITTRRLAWLTETWLMESDRPLSPEQVRTILLDEDHPPRGVRLTVLDDDVSTDDAPVPTRVTDTPLPRRQGPRKAKGAASTP